MASYSVGLLKPLSPEQLAWAMMQATGVVNQQLEAVLAKQKKSDDPQLAEDPVWQENAINTTEAPDAPPELVVRAVANDLVALLMGRQPMGPVTMDGDADVMVRFRDGIAGP